MHNVKKLKLTEEQTKAQNDKAIKLNDLFNKIIQLDRTSQGAENEQKYVLQQALMKATASLIPFECDSPTLWRIRRETLKEREEMIEDELNFLDTLVMSNPKSYAYWSHRLFVVKKLEKNDAEVLERENKFTIAVLLRDGRNFHCWNYRKDIDINNDEGFFFKLLSQDPTNYTAWFYLMENFKNPPENFKSLMNEALLLLPNNESLNEVISVYPAFFNKYQK